MKAALLLLCFVASTFGGLLGGRQEIQPDTLKNFDEIRLSLVKYFNGKYTYDKYFSVFEVQKLERQIVKGVNYFVQFTLIATKCKNHPANYGRLIGTSEGKCQATNSLPPQQCQAAVYDAPGDGIGKGPNVTEMECSPKIFLTLHRSVRSVSTKEEHAKIGSYEDFVAFKRRHGRVYPNSEEELKRFQIFRINMQKVHILNTIELGSGVYGHSPFADMTEEEFRKTRLSPQWDLSRMPEDLAKPVFTAPPAAFDWRDHGAVSEVKNQGSCGSCWAFSTTGNVEGQWAIKKKSLVSLSEQELVDCDHVDQGCNGGLPTNAYKVIQKIGGLETEKAYPYEGRDDSCKFNRNLAKVYINGSVSLPTDEGKMAAWLAVNGPISIGINANAMQFYFGGISHPWSIFCNPSKLDHGVLIVGYGMKGSEPYWIVKNSWGPSWGVQGYYLVYRGSGVCGLNRMPTSAVIN